MLDAKSIKMPVKNSKMLAKRLKIIAKENVFKINVIAVYFSGENGCK